MSYKISEKHQENVWSQLASRVVSTKFIRITHKALKKSWTFRFMKLETLL